MTRKRLAQQGILVMAHGKQRFINMAKNIAMSYKLTNIEIPIALVTDSSDKDLKKLYDYIIPFNPAFGKGLIQKIYMNEYTVFEETLYIDVDCLVIRNIGFLWELFQLQNANVSVIGRKVYEGKLFGVELTQIKNKLNLNYMISFNGGVYYFKSTQKAHEIFKTAKELVNRYQELGVDLMRGEKNEEPLFSLAMSIFREEPVNDSKKGMYTPMGQMGVFKMDSLKGCCEFYKHGEKVYPAIMHFGGGYPEAFHYRRETIKIKLVYKYRFPKAIVSPLVNLIFNPPYICYVFVYRLLKFLIKGTKFKLTPVMPMFKFE